MFFLFFVAEFSAVVILFNQVHQFNPTTLIEKGESFPTYHAKKTLKLSKSSDYDTLRWIL